MNRRLFQFLYSSVPMLTMIDCNINVDGSGNVNLFTGTLIKSVTHVSAGIYEITLVDQLNSPVLITCSMSSVPGTPSGVTCESVETTLSNIANTPAVFRVQCFNSAGTLTDPSPYSTINILLFARNSSVKY